MVIKDTHEEIKLCLDILIRINQLKNLLFPQNDSDLIFLLDKLHDHYRNRLPLVTRGLINDKEEKK